MARVAWSYWNTRTRTHTHTHTHTHTLIPWYLDACWLSKNTCWLSKNTWRVKEHVTDTRTLRLFGRDATSPGIADILGQKKMALFYKKKNWQPADAKLRLIVARTYKELGKISEKVNVLVHLCCKFIFPKKIYPGVMTWPSDIFSVPCFYFSHFFFIFYSGRHDFRAP